jgi:hypothetical protein
MKLVKETETKVVFRRGISLFFLFWSLGFAGFPLLAILAVISDVGITTLNCSRSQNQGADIPAVTCEVNSSILGGLYRLPTQSVPQVLRANQVTETTPDDDDCDQLLNHVLLLTSLGGMQTQVMGDAVYRDCVKGDVGLFSEYAMDLNRFIASDATSITLVYDNRFNVFNMLIVVFCSPFFAIGAIALLASLCWETLILNKQTGGMVYRLWFLLVLLKERTPSSFDVQNVELKVKESSDGDKTYEVALVMKSGKPIYFGTTGSKDEADTIANKLRQILALPGEQS